MTEAEQLKVLNDFFAWSGGELPQDEQHVHEYMMVSYPFGLDTLLESEVIDYLKSEILR